jgi:hypothetical protein
MNIYHLPGCFLLNLNTLSSFLLLLFTYCIPAYLLPFVSLNFPSTSFLQLHTATLSQYSCISAHSLSGHTFLTLYISPTLCSLTLFLWLLIPSHTMSSHSLARAMQILPLAAQVWIMHGDMSVGMTTVVHGYTPFKIKMMKKVLSFPSTLLHCYVFYSNFLTTQRHRRWGNALWFWWELVMMKQNLWLLIRSESFIYMSPFEVIICVALYRC